MKDRYAALGYPSDAQILEAIELGVDRAVTDAVDDAMYTAGLAAMPQPSYDAAYTDVWYPTFDETLAAMPPAQTLAAELIRLLEVELSRPSPSASLSTITDKLQADAQPYAIAPAARWVQHWVDSFGKPSA